MYGLSTGWEPIQVKNKKLITPHQKNNRPIGRKVRPFNLLV